MLNNSLLTCILILHLFQSSYLAVHQKTDSSEKTLSPPSFFPPPPTQKASGGGDVPYPREGGGCPKNMPGKDRGGGARQTQKPSGSRTPLGTRRTRRRKGGKELSHIFPEDYERGPFPECKRQLHGSDQFFKRLFLLLPSRKPQKAGERLSGRRRRVHTKKTKVVKLVPISLTKGGGGGWSDCGGVRWRESSSSLPPPLFSELSIACM